MTGSEVADLVGELKEGYAASSLWLFFLGQPDLPALLNSRGLDPGSTSSLGRKDNTYYRGIDVYASIAHAVGNANYNLRFLRNQFSMMLSLVADQLAENQYFDQPGTPRPRELELFRHLRNAASHGNRFNFRNDEPRRPAGFKAFVIDDTLKGNANPLYGTVAMFDFINPGDLFDLFDWVEGHLRSLP